MYSVSDSAFSQYFGFTEQEVRELVEYYNLSERFDEIKTWYDGYRFGKTEIYNPWSLLNFIDDTMADDSCIPDAYWVNTSSNSIIHELIVKSDRRIRDDIETLIKEILLTNLFIKILPMSI